jgi:hypothetical protein
MILKLLPLLLGAYLSYAGLGSLALAAFGEEVDALVDETVVKAVKEIPGGGDVAASYVVRARIAYHFEVCPRQGGTCATAEGTDTMILRTPYQVLSHDKGYAAPVVFLRFAPGINAVRQPRHLVVYGLLELLLGLAIVVFEAKVLLRERRERLAALRQTALPAPAAADPYHELGRPLSPESVLPPEPEEDIPPS